MISSLEKRHPQQPATAGQPQHPVVLARASRPKRSKHLRRSRKGVSRTKCPDRKQGTKGKPADGCGYRSLAVTHDPAMQEPPRLVLGGTHDIGEHSTTIIRQRVERRSEPVEVSMDGLWLPSVPSSESPNQDRKRSFEIDRWTLPPASAAVALPSRAGDGTSPSLGGRGSFSSRPATIASQAPFCAKATATPGAEKRSGATTASGRLRQRSQNDGGQRKHSASSHLGLSYEDFGEAAGGQSDPVESDYAATTRSTTGGAMGDGFGTSDALISGDTAIMIARSHALVEKAKVGVCISLVTGIYRVGC